MSATKRLPRNAFWSRLDTAAAAVGRAAAPRRAGRRVPADAPGGAHGAALGDDRRSPGHPAAPAPGR
jgi:hypothetical protein